MKSLLLQAALFYSLMNLCQLIYSTRAHRLKASIAVERNVAAHSLLDFQETVAAEALLNVYKRDADLLNKRNSLKRQRSSAVLSGKQYLIKASAYPHGLIKIIGRTYTQNLAQTI